MLPCQQFAKPLWTELNAREKTMAKKGKSLKQGKKLEATRTLVGSATGGGGAGKIRF